MKPMAPKIEGALPDLRAAAIIPARLASVRLPRKMLLAATGKPLFAHTVENVRAAGVFARVVVATDSPEVIEAARRAGIEAIATSVDHPSGTDRVHEAHAQLAARGERFDVVVNVQGDEPDLEHADLARLVRAFADREVRLATLAAPIEDAVELESPSVVKVVCDAQGDALYFSRAAIPFRGHARELETRAVGSSEPLARRHIGVYAFTPAALERFCALPRGVLEKYESLEQLRWLEAGLKLRGARGIDTLRDYEAFVEKARSAGASIQGAGTA